MKLLFSSGDGRRATPEPHSENEKLRRIADNLVTRQKQLS
jgi:hypothetical protein